MTMLGMFAGVVAGGFVYERMDATSRGALTLPDLIGVPYGVVVCGIVLVALAGFRGAEWIERRRS
jgi:hypothetical protein